MYAVALVARFPLVFLVSPPVCVCIVSRILEMFSIQLVGTRCYLAVLWSEIVLMLLSVVAENRRNVSTAR